jgi:tRNA(Leu) C34 or U34 (ribose-2'-O)-methylase TrmL
MGVSVLIIDPKYPHNVGNALRACACFGADRLAWSGNRVPDPADWPPGARLPREERMRLYRSVDLAHGSDWSEAWHLVGGASADVVPVCVERSPRAERLDEFVHPEVALYVFGPEDGGVPKGARHVCHRFVSIPTMNDGPLNLAAAVNVVLYDRLAKLGARAR